jgi:hypothetical protein
MVVEVVVAAVKEPLALPRDDGERRLEHPERQKGRAQEEPPHETLFDDTLQRVEVAPGALLERVAFAADGPASRSDAERPGGRVLDDDEYARDDRRPLGKPVVVGRKSLAGGCSESRLAVETLGGLSARDIPTGKRSRPLLKVDRKRRSRVRASPEYDR